MISITSIITGHPDLAPPPSLLLNAKLGKEVLFFFRGTGGGGAARLWFVATHPHIADKGIDIQVEIFVLLGASRRRR